MTLSEYSVFQSKLTPKDVYAGAVNAICQGTVISAFYLFILTTVLWNKYYDCLHFSEKEAEIQG